MRRLPLFIVAISICLGSFSISAIVSATPYVGSCAPEEDEYEYLVERKLRASWQAELEILVIRLAVPGRTETAVGLSRDSSGPSLVRLQFDRSLWQESFIDVDGGEEQDFSIVPARVTTTSIPVSNRLGEAFFGAFDSIEVSDGDERLNVVVVDGVLYEIIKNDGTCLSLHSPPQDSIAGKMMELFWYLDRELLAWRIEGRQPFETDVLRRIDQIPTTE